MKKSELQQLIREEIRNILKEIKTGDRVKLIYKGYHANDQWAKYFNGATGRVQEIEKDGGTKMYRVDLDKSVTVPNIGKVTNDLWAGEFLKKIGN